MIETLERLEREFDRALDDAGEDPAAIERLRVRFLGRKGELTELMRGLAEVPEERRRDVGQQLNRVKQQFQQRITDLQQQSRERWRERELASDVADLTLPGREPWIGSLHPVTRTRMELERIFRDMGFTVETGPEVEDDFHNFQALNLPPDHPARDDTDTFYLEGGLLLRTHTSPVQIRTMLACRPPIRMVGPGRVYRRDMDATHLPMFHQLEALVVGEAVSMADLKGTLAAVWRSFFGTDVEMRLRPGYFPFVEPGCEYDARWPGAAGWIELGGAGMVHPAVFEAVGIDPERYSGFAFGLGIERIAMLRYGIPDLRLLVENDVRFLSQFPV